MTEPLQILLANKAVIVVAWIAALLLLERWRPAAPAPSAPDAQGRLVRNAVLWAATMAVSVFFVAPITAWSSGTALAWRPDWWSGLAGLLFDLIVLDCLIYWWHRANHGVPFLWRFHQVHHLDRTLDATTALCFHPGEVALSAVARMSVILLLGFPLSSVIVFEILVLLAASFQHSNLRLPKRLERVLSWIVVTPSIHWMHHHAVRRDTDSNYATILSLWDRLFGTKNPKRRRLEMTIGVEGTADRGALSLLLLPFGPQAVSAPDPGSAGSRRSPAP